MEICTLVMKWMWDEVRWRESITLFNDDKLLLWQTIINRLYQYIWHFAASFDSRFILVHLVFDEIQHRVRDYNVYSIIFQFNVTNVSEYQKKSGKKNKLTHEWDIWSRAYLLKPPHYHYFPFIGKWCSNHPS